MPQRKKIAVKRGAVKKKTKPATVLSPQEDNSASARSQPETRAVILDKPITPLKYLTECCGRRLYAAVTKRRRIPYSSSIAMVNRLFQKMRTSPIWDSIGRFPKRLVDQFQQLPKRKRITRILILISILSNFITIGQWEKMVTTPPPHLRVVDAYDRSSTISTLLNEENGNIEGYEIPYAIVSENGKLATGVYVQIVYPRNVNHLLMVSPQGRDRDYKKELTTVHPFAAVGDLAIPFQDRVDVQTMQAVSSRVQIVNSEGQVEPAKPVDRAMRFTVDYKIMCQESKPQPGKLTILAPFDKLSNGQIVDNSRTKFIVKPSGSALVMHAKLFYKLEANDSRPWSVPPIGAQVMLIDSTRWYPNIRLNSTNFTIRALSTEEPEFLECDIRCALAPESNKETPYPFYVENPSRYDVAKLIVAFAPEWKPLIRRVSAVHLGCEVNFKSTFEHRFERRPEECEFWIKDDDATVMVLFPLGRFWLPGK